MFFTKSHYIFLFFLTILFITSINTVFGQTFNETNFRIDTLKASYTSGSTATEVIGSVYVSFKIPAGYTANLLMKTNPTGAYQSQGTFGDVTSTELQRVRTSIPNLKIRTDVYCFFLELKNGNAILATKELCSIPFIKESTNSANNRLVFQVGSYQPGTKTTFATFRPFITGKCISDLGCSDDIDDFATNTRNVAPYRVRKEYGSEVKCGELKIFETLINIDGMITISDTIRNVGDTKQSPAKLVDEWIYATIENRKVKLIWKNNEVTTKNNSYTIEKKFIIERKEGPNGTYITLPTRPDLERMAGSLKTSWDFTDTNADPEKKQYFYKVKYEDYCANLSPDIEISPIFLQQDKKVFDLLWTAENNDKVADYEVEYFDIPSGDPRNTLLITPKANRYDAETANYYRVKGQQTLGDGAFIYSNFIPNDENLTVLNPTVFTPDGKGPEESETFKVTSVSAVTFNIAIYNRQGLLVYFSDDYKAHRRDGWNGKLIYTDIDLPEDVYAFQVEVTNSNRRNFTKRGSVLLVRD
jgi:regulator of replication initiation timing